MNNNKQHKRITYSLASLLVGSLLFIFALGINNSNVLLITQYCLAILLYTISYLSNYQGYKKTHRKINIYICFLSLGLIVLITFVFVNLII